MKASDLIPEPLSLPDEQPVQRMKLFGIELVIVIDPRMRDDTAILHNEHGAAVWDGQAGTVTYFPLRRGAKP